MKPGTLKIDAFTEGDTFEGLPSVTLRKAGVAPSSPISLVTMRFKKEAINPPAVVELSSAVPAEIQIIAAEDWSFRVPEQTVAALTEGKWQWRIRVTAVDGIRDTWLTGEIQVLESI